MVLRLHSLNERLDFSALSVYLRGSEMRGILTRRVRPMFNDNEDHCMARLLTLFACSLLLIGADLPTRGYVFDLRGDAFFAMHTTDALKQAVVEYTSAILQRPGNAEVLAARALVYAEMGLYKPAIHDADTAMIYGNDELTYCYVVGRSKPSIERLRRAFGLACARGDRDLIPVIGKLLLHYETRYLYVTEEDIFP
ncbi:MAG: hypothetical protein JW765_06030 [Deltaproteobacteria bacterium]|nr:hypothetical protein [Candidatus Zymogenaceae bacterium]